MPILYSFALTALFSFAADALHAHDNCTEDEVRNQVYEIIAELEIPYNLIVGVRSLSDKYEASFSYQAVKILDQGDKVKGRLQAMTGVFKFIKEDCALAGGLYVPAVLVQKP
jgi:hypothetical protein